MASKLNVITALTVWLRSISYTLQGMEIIFTKLHLAQTFFFNVYCWARTFSLVLMFPRLRIEAPPLCTVQGKCINTFLKQRTRKLNFHSFVLNLVKIKISFFLSIVGSHRLIYRSAIPSMYYQFGRFIGQACHNSQIERVDLSPIRQDFWADLSPNHSQRVSTIINNCYHSTIY